LNDPAPEDTGPSVSPEDAPKLCADCSRPLSVGERMFYFLEGAGSTPTCRACLARRQADGDLPEEEALALGPLSELEARYGKGTEGWRALAHAVRAFLEDEMDRIDVVVDRLPEDHPDLALVRSVQHEAQGHLSRNRLAEAIVSMSDLRRILTEIDRGHQRVPLTSPWDESIEELFDRVITRARAMSRRVPPVLEGDEEPTEPIARESSSAPRVGS